MDPELRGVNGRTTSQGATDDSGNWETVIAVAASDTANSDTNANGPAPKEDVIEAEAAKVEGETQCPSCSVDFNSVGKKQRVCRICHLTAKESDESLADLIELGCGCKGDLEVAHLQCAEAWFQLKGNRLCEICGETAKNITGAGDKGFLEEWNDGRSGDGGTNASNGSRTCFGGQPLCNLLIAFLVIAFVLPWFFRVNMF